MPKSKQRVQLTPLEIRAAIGLTVIYMARMAGLFLVLPVFYQYAQTITGGDDSTTIGLALGIFGFSQFVLQIPFGWASDRWGRKPVIFFGLLLFLLGSVIAALAEQVMYLALGRLLQGSGAISGVLAALVADLTTASARTRIMAMIGAAIGVTFAVSLVISPVMYALLGMSGIFWFCVGLALLAALILFLVVPSPTTKPAKAQPPLVNAGASIQYAYWNIFMLHSVQMAMWVIVPAMLTQSGVLLQDHWLVYLPVIVISMVLMGLMVVKLEMNGRLIAKIKWGLLLLLFAQGALITSDTLLSWLVVALILFFWGFNVLEAMLPSWLSQQVSGAKRGAVMGGYYSAQSLGTFAGGLGGGWLLGAVGGYAIFLCALCLISVSLLWSFLIKEDVPA